MNRHYQTVQKLVIQYKDDLKTMSHDIFKNWAIALNFNKDIKTVSRLNDELDRMGIDHQYEIISYNRVLSRGWTKVQITDHIKPIFGLYFDLDEVRMIESKTPTILSNGQSAFTSLFKTT